MRVNPEVLFLRLRACSKSSNEKKKHKRSMGRKIVLSNECLSKEVLTMENAKQIRELAISGDVLVLRHQSGSTSPFLSPLGEAAAVRTMVAMRDDYMKTEHFEDEKAAW